MIEALEALAVAILAGDETEIRWLHAEADRQLNGPAAAGEGTR